MCLLSLTRVSCVYLSCVLLTLAVISKANKVKDLVEFERWVLNFTELVIYEALKLAAAVSTSVKQLFFTVINVPKVKSSFTVM